MAVLQLISCSHCGEDCGVVKRRMIRKEPCRFAVKCPRCNRYIKLTNHALEWEVLSERQKLIRYLSTAIVAIATGAECSLLITAGLFLLPMVVGNRASNSSIPIDEPVFLIPFILIGILLVVLQYYRMIMADIEWSARSLADAEYRQVLRAIGKTLPAKYDSDL